MQASGPAEVLNGSELAPAKWIWLPSQRTLPNTVVLFRREVYLEARPLQARGWISADSRSTGNGCSGGRPPAIPAGWTSIRSISSGCLCPETMCWARWSPFRWTQAAPTGPAQAVVSARPAGGI
jgi:hypothetical protein